MNLHQLRILVARPKPQGNILCEKIRAAGGLPTYLPVIEIVPPENVSLLKKQIATLNQFDYLIFISPQAVMQSVPFIRKQWSQFPAQLKLVAVGAGTANALHIAGYSDVIFPENDWRTEGLLELSVFQQLKDKKIAIIRGEGGRELLADTLTARGATVTLINAYQRKLPQTDVSEYVKLLKSHQIDIVICTSSQSLQNLLLLLGKKEILEIPVIVVSERIADSAKESGFKKIILAENASDESILETLSKQKGLFMENKMDENKAVTKSPASTRQRSIPWSGLGVMFTAFGIIVLITAFCFSFYRISFLSKQLADTQTQLQSKVDGLQTTVDSVSQSTQQSSDDMKHAIADLRQSESSDKDAWRVIQAQYYVKLANSNLQFEDNTSVAIQLLQTADHEIHDLNDPKLDPLRKSLADDIASLQAVPQVDYTGLYLRLSAMDGEVDKLPMMTRALESNVALTPENTNQAWWRRGLDESWRALQKIVIIRYQASGVPPLVTPEQQDFLMQNIHGMLQRAMWSLVNKNEVIYAASLTQASEWVQKYFVANSSVTQSMLTNLTQLQQINIHPDVPKTITSLQVFHDYFANGATT